MINKIFKNLTVIKEGSGKKYKNGKQVKTWICKCSCGKTCEVVTSKLNNGHTTSCGCKIGGYLDLTGKRFGRLIVLENVGRLTKSPNVYWKCKCDCGNYKNVRADYLRNGGTSSCGCFGDENRRKKGRWKEREQICSICGKTFTYKSSITPKCCSKDCRKKFDADRVRLANNSSFKMKLTNQIRGIKSRCKKNAIACDISKEFILDQFNKQNGRCLKTNIKFVLNNCDQAGGRSPWSPSVDRIDSNKGYTKDNVQLVCLMYNFCKGVWSDDEVKQFATAIRDYE